MTKAKWVTRVAKIVMLLAPGATLLGTSCSVEVRDAAIGAGADFVGASLGTILETLVPVEEWLAGDTGDAA